MTALHAEIARSLENSGCAVSGARAAELSYAELGDRAAQLRDMIAALPEGRGVGILSTRRWEAYAGVLGCFFAGRHFVPLNPELPVERLKKILRHGNIGLIIHDKTTAELANGLATPLVDPAKMADTPTAPLARGPFPLGATTAYQMFTSGSTGDPKGVPVTYDSLSEYIMAVRPAVGLTDAGRYSQFFDLAFDLAMHDIFVALANGGTIVPAGMMDLLMPHAYISKKRIDHWFSVPMLAMVATRGLGDGTPTHHLKTALFCGEPLPVSYAYGFQCFLEEGGVLWNLYGPTETTIAFTCKPVEDGLDPAGIVPLGAPFGANTLAVETEEDQITDATDGVRGELLLGGPQVFSGYQPATDIDCFTATQPPYYRSGDLVEIHQGELHHLGRTDSQIKLRGYRIELGDIEVAMRRTFACDAVAAVVLGEGETREIAVAYEAADNITDLQPLAEHLPNYMMPARLLRVNKMPLNTNGKTDRKTLCAMAWPA